MATPAPGPSYAVPQTATHPPAPDSKRRPEADADPGRRVKQHRPPLPPPHVLATLVPDSPAFAELMKIEQKLDWTLLRKKAEINDALGRPTRVKRTLRVFISNTVHDQAWQTEQQSSAPDNLPGSSTQPSASAPPIKQYPGPSFPSDVDVVSGSSEDVNMTEYGAIDDVKRSDSKEVPKEMQLEGNVDVNSGRGVAGWVLRVEGRLLDSGNARLDKSKRKFTTFLRSAVVEFDKREPPTFPEGNIVEWHPQTLQAPLDGFEVLRRGDVDVECRVILHVAHYPERFRVMPPLANLIATQEGTRSDVMAAVWKLVKIAGAQDKDDGTILRPVGGLERIMPPGQEGVPFHQLPELVTRFLTHPDPIVIPYAIRVDREYNFHPKCFDIPIEMEDPLKSKMAQVVQHVEGQEGKEIVKLEDNVGELAYFAKDLKQKRDFLESFAANPQAFIHNWLAAQARDLDQMLGYQIGTAGLNGGSVREEDLRRSDLFNMPWVDEAVTIHEASRMESERKAMAGTHMR